MAPSRIFFVIAGPRLIDDPAEVSPDRLACDCAGKAADEIADCTAGRATNDDLREPIICTLFDAARMPWSCMAWTKSVLVSFPSSLNMPSSSMFFPAASWASFS